MNPVRLQVLVHVPFEGPGHFASWAEARGHRISITRLYAEERVPEPRDYDWLLVMGGPMGVHDESQFPWLGAEKAAIRDAIELGKVVLGVCLGAQLIACVLGARVYANTEKEIGWFSVTKTPSVSVASFFPDMPATLHVLHWHGDTFDMPPGAQRLFRSGACENQGFVVGERVFGFQFHLESTPEGLRALVQNCANELLPGRYIQSGAEILGARSHFAKMHAILERFLDIVAQNEA